MTTLHIVNKSPFEKRSLDQCVSRAAPGGSLLLIEDAVTAATSNTIFTQQLSQASEALTLYVLGPDLQARGFGDVDLLPQFTTVDYSGFVNLVTKHARVHSWL